MNLGGLITGGLTSLLSGGALGVLGAVGSGVLDIIKTKEKNKQELALLAAQKELIAATGNNQAYIEALKLTGASYEQDKAAYENAGFVDTVRGLLRPTVTLYLVAAATALALWAFRKVGVNDAVVAEIAKYAVFTCLDLASMCISWYFGARQIEKVNRNPGPAKKKQTAN